MLKVLLLVVSDPNAFTQIAAVHGPVAAHTEARRHPAGESTKRVQAWIAKEEEEEGKKKRKREGKKGVRDEKMHRSTDG